MEGTRFWKYISYKYKPVFGHAYLEHFLCKWKKKLSFCTHSHPPLNLIMYQYCCQMLAHKKLEKQQQNTYWFSRCFSPKWFTNEEKHKQFTDEVKHWCLNVLLSFWSWKFCNFSKILTFLVTVLFRMYILFTYCSNYNNIITRY